MLGPEFPGEGRGLVVRRADSRLPGLLGSCGPAMRKGRRTELDVSNACEEMGEREGEGEGEGRECGGMGGGLAVRQGVGQRRGQAGTRQTSSSSLAVHR